MNRELLEFYTGDGKDNAGRTHSELLNFDDKDLELTHDFIQWLFPTETPSAYNPDAPLLDAETVYALHSGDNYSTFLTRYLSAAGRVLRFWGFSYTVEHGDIKVNPITERQPWMTHDNHNLLRMSRLMESARLLGFEVLSTSLFEAVLAIAGNRKLQLETAGEGSFCFITAENVYYWYRSAFGRTI
jgi:hypothetical protein